MKCNNKFCNTIYRQKIIKCLKFHKKVKKLLKIILLYKTKRISLVKLYQLHVSGGRQQSPGVVPAVCLWWVFGRVVCLPQLVKFVLIRSDELRLLGHHHVLLVALHRGHGPVQGAGYELPVIQQRKFMMHVHADN